MLIKDERTLITEIKKGNVPAFERIFSMFHKRIFNFCLHLNQTEDQAEDTVQRVFLALWEQRNKIDENKPLEPYIYGISRFIIYQDFKQQVYKKAAFDHYILNSLVINDSTKDEVLFNELKTFLDSQIEKLPDRQRQIFKLSRFTGLTYKQISEQLEITENTVDTQMRRALEFLRDRYRSYYMD